MGVWASVFIRFCFALKYNQIIKPIVIRIARVAMVMAIQVGIKCVCLSRRELICLNLLLTEGGCWSVQLLSPHEEVSFEEFQVLMWTGRLMLELIAGLNVRRVLLALQPGVIVKILLPFS